MISNSAPTNEAILSNVGETGEFKIRNSQKAFSILSGGLYANKIRAIVRELSCNARDSHVEAGKRDIPFDVHLPTELEPWFSIRDYGTGLDHEQVIDIMTVYFESTKTTSNDFIGALGLGSKSPFSYTDNFTVTAIKDHMKRIYTAYINEVGVPSVALMMEEETNEPNGVEIQFGVEDRWDGRKFVDEASTVFIHFDVLPNFTGRECSVRKYKYSDVDIVPGVNVYSSHKNSTAIMGNIEYPINVPNSKSNLGDLAELLNFSLELRFEIGELDIQASREGLSYIPSTIKAIRDKLEQLNNALADVIAQEANKIENEWERAIYLDNKIRQNRMWEPAVTQYVKTSGFDLFIPAHWNHLYSFEVDEVDLANDYNIKINAFSHSRNSLSASTLKPTKTGARGLKADLTKFTWIFHVDENVNFVVNDTKIGAAERAKYHWKTNSTEYRSSVYVLSPADKEQAMKTDEFFKLLRSPPNVVQASELDEKPRKDSLRSDTTVSILRLEATGSYSRDRSYVWRDAGTLAAADSTKTMYYLPLSGYALETEYGIMDSKELGLMIIESKLLREVKTVYGVRKSDIKNIKSKANWVNVEEYFIEKMKDPSQNLIRKIAREELSKNKITVEYPANVTRLINDPTSKFLEVANELAGVDTFSMGYATEKAIVKLARRYADAGVVDPIEAGKVLANKCEKALDGYPMLKLINTYGIKALTLADYVNMVDSFNANKV